MDNELQMISNAFAEALLKGEEFKLNYHQEKSGERHNTGKRVTKDAKTGTQMRILEGGRTNYIAETTPGERVQLVVNFRLYSDSMGVSMLVSDEVGGFYEYGCAYLLAGRELVVDTGNAKDLVEYDTQGGAEGNLAGVKTQRGKLRKNESINVHWFFGGETRLRNFEGYDVVNSILESYLKQSR